MGLRADEAATPKQLLETAIAEKRIPFRMWIEDLAQLQQSLRWLSIGDRRATRPEGDSPMVVRAHLRPDPAQYRQKLVGIVDDVAAGDPGGSPTDTASNRTSSRTCVAKSSKSSERV
jgi:hypothetical protein